jgi:hypothetical protein
MQEKIHGVLLRPALPFELECLEGQTLPVQEIFLQQVIA